MSNGKKKHSVPSVKSVTKIAEHKGITDPRRLRFLALWIGEGKSARVAAVEAGYSKGYSERITSNLSVDVRNVMREALDSSGITPDYLASKELEILESDSLKAKNAALTRLYRLMGASGEQTTAIINNNNQKVEITDRRTINNITARYEAELRKAYVTEISQTRNSKPDTGEGTNDEGPGPAVDSGGKGVS